MRTNVLFASLGICLLAGSLSAQPFYVRGDMNGFGTTDQLLDDGNAPDATASDGIYTLSITGVTAGTWKAADAGWAVFAPPGSNSHYPTGDVTFYYDTNNGTAYTAPVLVRSSYTAVGSFQGEAGGSDWDPADTNFNMADDGVAPDAAAADGIYSLEVVVSTIGTGYEYKVATEGGWNAYQIGADGFHDNASTVLFDTTVTDEIVNLFCDTNFNSVSAVPTGLQFTSVNDWQILD